MKVVSTEALTKLIQLVKSAFISVDDTVATSEVDVYTKSEVTTYLNSKADLNLSNTASNIDFVVESQTPTAANNYTWYRKYKSGWVEQGGSYRISPAIRDVSATINFPIVFSNNNYVAACCPTSFEYSNNNTGFIFTQQKTASNCIFHVYTNNAGSVCDGFDWQVSGIAAN